MIIHSSSHITTRSDLVRVRSLPPVVHAAIKRKSLAPAAHSIPEGCIAAKRIESELALLDKSNRAASIDRVPVVTTPRRPQIPGGARPHKTDAIEYRLIFSAAFAVFLVTCAFERALNPRALARSEDQSMRKSIVAQAKEAANISAAYAFMG